MTAYRCGSTSRILYQSKDTLATCLFCLGG
nr:MAG TPA: hypothetical protein [Caudoviricetes sp.]